MALAEKDRAKREISLGCGYEERERETQTKGGSVVFVM
jgi:hypothetical protein